MRRAREARHVGPHFGDDHFGHTFTDPRNRVQLGLLTGERDQPGRHLSFHRLDLLVQVPHVVQLQPQHEMLMRCQPTVEGLRELFPRGLESRVCEPGDVFRTPLAFRQCRQHRAAALAQNVADDRTEFDVATFQDFLDAVGLGCPLVDQGDAVPDQLAQLPLRPRRNQAGFQQPMAHQIADPFRVLDIGFAARDGF